MRLEVTIISGKAAVYLEIILFELSFTFIISSSLNLSIFVRTKTQLTAAVSSSFIIVLSKSPIPRLLSINRHTVLSVGLPFKYFKVRDVHDFISFFGAFA